MFADLVKKTRSFRRFKQEPAPTITDLESLVGLARLSPSASNKQPLKYVFVKGQDKLPQVFSCLKWAGYLPDWDGPAVNEQPTAYIVCLTDKELGANPNMAYIDRGLATQNIILGAQTMGYGACLLASVNRRRLQEILDIPEHLEISLVVALGTPGEQVVLTDVGNDGDIRYWRDEAGVHYVPKRSLKDIIYRVF